MGDHLPLDLNQLIEWNEKLAAKSSSDELTVAVDESGASYDDEEALLLSMTI